MDDHNKDNQNDSRRREESVLEQRYKELYGTGDALPPEDAEAATPEAEAHAPSDADATNVTEAADTPEEASSETAAPAAQKEAAKADRAPEKRAPRHSDPPARPRRPAWDEEEDDAPPRTSSLTGAPSKRSKQPAQKRPAPEPSGKRQASSRRVDTLERSQARRGYGQPPQKQMKLWPWLLVGGILVLALVGLLIYSMLRPLPGSTPSAQGTPAPTGIPASVIGQPTLGPTTDLSGFLPTPDPTPEPTAVPGTPTPDVSTILRPKDSGALVRQLQQRLIELGYMAAGTDDGDYGNTTQGAVVAFQKAHGLQADGYAGSQTLTILYSDEAKVAPTATPKP